MKAYLIGNGASIPYGAPLGADIFKRALELFYDGWKYNPDNQYRRLKEYIAKLIRTMDDLKNQLAWGNLDFLHMGEFSEEFEVLSNPKTLNAEGIQAYRKIESCFSKYNIWELLPEIIEYCKDRELHGYRDFKSKRLALLEGQGNFFNKIADFSFKTIYFAIKHSNCNLNYYTNFVRAIDNSSEDTIIINLNYDNLLEKALKKNFKGIVEYGFGDKVHCFPSPQFGEDTGQKVILFKPHGSFDFLFCDKCKSITISENVPLEYSQDITNKRGCKKPHCDKRNLPNFFIPYASVAPPNASETPPIRYRDIILFSIIENMKQRLNGINEITAIGYSFSEYKGELIDKHLKFIFENRKVLVVAKDTSENKRICKRLIKFNINAENSGFNGFADFICHMSNDFFTDK